MSRHHPPVGHVCTRTRLAAGETSAVDRCECGTIHLHIGALTMRLTGPALEDLALTLGQSLRALARTTPMAQLPRGEA